VQSQKEPVNSQNKILKSGLGYVDIYNSKLYAIQLSEETMRVVNKMNGNQKLYLKIKKEENKRKIEHRSENWHRLSDYSEKYWIFIQKDANEHETGFVKILLKEKSEITGFFEDRIVAKNQNDWKYYARRRKIDEF